MKPVQKIYKKHSALKEDSIVNNISIIIEQKDVPLYAQRSGSCILLEKTYGSCEMYHAYDSKR
jgi:hypothetical protein